MVLYLSPLLHDKVKVEVCMDFADKRMKLMDAIKLAKTIRGAVETVVGVDVADVHIETDLEYPPAQPSDTPLPI